MNKHNDLINRVWFALRNQAANDLFTRNVALVDDSTTVGWYNRLSAVDKAAVNDLFTSNKLFITEYNNMIMIGRTL